MRRRLLYILVALCAIVLASCEHKELCYHHPHTVKIRVEFDWRNAPDANPEGMSVWFYPMEDGATPRRFDFRGTTGGEVELAIGSYRIIAYNNDSEVDISTGTGDYYSHEVYTRDGYIFEPVYGNATGASPHNVDGEHVAICPDMLWGDHVMDIVVTEDGVTYLDRSGEEDHTGGETVQVITLYPKEEICTYTYEIRRVTNLKSTTQLCGSLSGLAHGLFMGTEEIEHERVTVPFEAVSDGASTVTGKFLTFGHCTSHDPHTIFTLYVWMKDGKKLYYTFDVTDQVDNAPDPRHVHIIIDGLDLPQPIEDDDGFHVDIDDWEVVNEDILM